MIKLKVKTYLLIFLIPLMTAAQEKFEKHEIPSATIINDVFVAGNGHVFLATDKGLLEFDGDEWITFTTDNGLPSNDIKDIEWYKNEMYVSTSDKGLAVYDLSKGWTSLEIKAPSEFSFISYIFGDGETLVLGTNNGKIFHKKSTSLDLVEVDYSHQGLGEITGMGRASSGVVNILSDQGVLLVVTNQGDFEIRIRSNTSPLTSDNVISGYMDGDVYYDCTDQGITIADYSPPGIPPGINTVTANNSSLPSNRVNQMAVFDSKWFIGTDKGMAVRKTAVDWEIYDISNSNIESNNVVKLSHSNNGTIWFVTEDNGLVLHKYSEYGRLGTGEKPTDQDALVWSYVDNNTIEVTIENTSEIHGERVLRLTDLSGKVMVERTVKMESGSDKININTAELSNGIYVLSLTENEIYVQTVKLYVD